MRPPVFDVYELKAEHLPEGVKAAWLRTWPDQRPDADRWSLVGQERHPSRSTIAEMNKYGLCYRELASWLASAK